MFMMIQNASIQNLNMTTYYGQPPLNGVTYRLYTFINGQEMTLYLGSDEKYMPQPILLGTPPTQFFNWGFSLDNPTIFAYYSTFTIIYLDQSDIMSSIYIPDTATVKFNRTPGPMANSFYISAADTYFTVSQTSTGYILAPTKDMTQRQLFFYEQTN